MCRVVNREEESKQQCHRGTRKVSVISDIEAINRSKHIGGDRGNSQFGEGTKSRGATLFSTKG
jgi:hypothetical protein